jgi:hypothetical protein
MKGIEDEASLLTQRLTVQHSPNFLGQLDGGKWLLNKGDLIDCGVAILQKVLIGIA